jgi:hypothetical protein
MVKYYKTQIIICIIILLIIPISTIAIITQNTVNFKYKIDINSPSHNNYTLYFPIPLDNEKPSEILSKIKIKGGEIKYQIIDTIYGKALQIKGVGNASLGAIGTDFHVFNIKSKYNGLEISMFNNSREREYRGYWFYYNSSINNSITINFQYEFSDDWVGSGQGFDYEYKGNLNHGWNLLEGDDSSWIACGGPTNCCISSGMLMVIVIFFMIFISVKHIKDKKKK